VQTWYERVVRARAERGAQAEGKMRAGRGREERDGSGGDTKDEGAETWAEQWQHACRRGTGESRGGRERSEPDGRGDYRIRMRRNSDEPGKSVVEGEEEENAVMRSRDEGDTGAREPRDSICTSARDG